MPPEDWESEALLPLLLVYRRSFAALYEARFGDLPAPLRAAIDASEDEDTLKRWVVLAGTGSAEDITAAVLGPDSANGSR